MSLFKLAGEEIPVGNIATDDRRARSIRDYIGALPVQTMDPAYSLCTSNSFVPLSLRTRKTLIYGGAADQLVITLLNA